GIGKAAKMAINLSPLGLIANAGKKFQSTAQAAGLHMADPESMAKFAYSMTPMGMLTGGTSDLPAVAFNNKLKKFFKKFGNGLSRLFEQAAEADTTDNNDNNTSGDSEDGDTSGGDIPEKVWNY